MRYLVLFLIVILSCSPYAVPSDLRTSSIANRRREAAVNIGNERIKRMKPALLKAVSSDPVSLVRAEAAVALGKLDIRDQTVYRTLTSVLKNDPNPLVQQDVIKALRMLRYKKAAEVIAEKLKSSSHQNVRQRAAEALGQLGSEKSYSALLMALQPKNKYRVRRASYVALKNLTGLDGPFQYKWWNTKLR